ncbi:anthranilate phosphoribosyltransferase [Candidatus Kaiserbacteria bacterium]|nr:anthranilate phosphoribosyltransferase [Candidatus Kaiserbacteria bacterium]
MDATALLNTLVAGDDIPESDAVAFLDALMRGEVSAVQAGAILTALRIKGETASEISGFIRAMRAAMIPVDAPGALDIVGTGGDNSGTFNISTTAALIAVGAGAKIAKHGNRAASSKCGSADVLEALGVRIELTKSDAERVYAETGMVFLFAPAFHPATKGVVQVRKELKIRTIFNVLGPFLNPAGAKRQLVGVPDAAVASTMADVAASLGYERLMIVASDDGMDEVSTAAPTRVYELKGDIREEWVLEPERFGFAKPERGALSGGTAEQNAAIVKSILGGEKGPKRDIAVLNAACGLVVAGIADSIEDGIARAEDSIESGSARNVLDALVSATNKHP